MFIVLNGPLGIGKSTLAEALTESFDDCVMLDGDRIAAVNPPAAMSEIICIRHSRCSSRILDVTGIAISSSSICGAHRPTSTISAADCWPSTRTPEVRCFLLTLPADENLRRIVRRQQSRAIDEREFELTTYAEERAALMMRSDLGEPFDVSAAPSELVSLMLRRLAWR